MRSTRSFIRAPQPYGNKGSAAFPVLSVNPLTGQKARKCVHAVVTRQIREGDQPCPAPSSNKIWERHSGRVADVRCRSDFAGHRAVVTRSRGLFGMRKTAGFCLDFGRISSCRAIAAVSLAIECYPLLAWVRAGPKVAASPSRLLVAKNNGFIH
jgi:hypothetical protein